MISLTVKAVDGKTDVYGMNAEDLQSDIVIGEDEITGTLKHVKSYTGFNPGDESEQEGNFLALSFSAEKGEITTELVNGTKGPVTVDDGFCVYRITDNNQQKVKVTVSDGDQSEVKEYKLNGLTLSEE